MNLQILVACHELKYNSMSQPMGMSLILINFIVVVNFFYNILTVLSLSYLTYMV